MLFLNVLIWLIIFWPWTFYCRTGIFGRLRFNLRWRFWIIFRIWTRMILLWTFFVLIMKIVSCVFTTKIWKFFLHRRIPLLNFRLIWTIALLLLFGSLSCSPHNLLILKELLSSKLLKLFFLSFLFHLFFLIFSHFLCSHYLLLSIILSIHIVSIWSVALPIIFFIFYLLFDVLCHLTVFLVLFLNFSLLLLFSSLLLKKRLLSFILFSLSFFLQILFSGLLLFQPLFLSLSLTLTFSL